MEYRKPSSSFSFGSKSSSSSASSWKRPQFKCRCGVDSPLCTAWTVENPGRRFFGCGLYTKSRGKVCNFFKWYDEACSEREKKLINALLKKNDLLQNSNKKLVIGIVCLGLIVMFMLIVIVMLMFM